jgi:hypothetical protein
LVRIPAELSTQKLNIKLDMIKDEFKFQTDYGSDIDSPSFGEKIKSLTIDFGINNDFYHNKVNHSVDPSPV